MDNNKKLLNNVNEKYIKERKKIKDMQMKKKLHDIKKMNISDIIAIDFKDERKPLFENIKNYQKEFCSVYVYDGPQAYEMCNIDIEPSSPKVKNIKSNILDYSEVLESSPHIRKDTDDFNPKNDQKEDISDDDVETIDISNIHSSLISETVTNDYDWDMNDDDVFSVEPGNSISNSLNLTEAKQDREEFALLPAPQNVTMKCRIYRDQKGLKNGFFPTYHLYLDCDDGKRSFLLAARLRKKSTSSNYLISSSATDLKRNCESFVGKLRSNLMGTNYVVFDYGQNSHSKFEANYKECRRELSGISYDTSAIGLKGPRKMAVVIPGMNHNNTRMEFYKRKGTDSLLEYWKKKEVQNLLVLHNRTPICNEDSHSYVFNCHSRSTQSSVKNFQLVQDNDVDYIVMQFGRISEDMFSMDFSYPLCAMQAFGIALSSFDSKVS